MGLDMYLEAEVYLWHNQQNEKKAIEALIGINLPVKKVVFEAAYWRKENHIHAWFVKNVQDGKDECQRSYVLPGQLQELVDTCRKVLENPKLGKELLPTQGGFFFGPTDYDSGYLDGIRNTIEQLETALKIEGVDFYYRASW